jgi:hypothetical protein
MSAPLDAAALRRAVRHPAVWSPPVMALLAFVPDAAISRDAQEARLRWLDRLLGAP